MFDQMVEGADKYITEQGSTWLIFTKEKKWVVEFTNDKTLWFNYNLFKSELELIGKDCTEERDFIKNWFESRFLGIKPVEDTIQNGVKRTELSKRDFFPKDTIQNGVRHTSKRLQKPFRSVEDTIQNGVKHTNGNATDVGQRVEDTIQNGVRHTKSAGFDVLAYVEDTIQNGIRHTLSDFIHQRLRVEDTIQNGIRQTNLSVKVKANQIEDTIQNGICDVKHSYDFEEIVVKDIIEDSYPHKHRVEGVIRNTVKDGI